MDTPQLLQSAILSPSLTPNTNLIHDTLSPSCVSPISEKQPAHLSPNDYKYYQNHLAKSQFNLVLINCCINLTKCLYPDSKLNTSNLRFFMIEILRRSKTSIQTLQVCSYYLLKLLKNEKQQNTFLPSDPKKLFLGLVILASKFNQDVNYSFNTWLKICGSQNNTTFDVKALRRLEMDLLTALDYNCYVNHVFYENWCNILLIFGYDFIEKQKIVDYQSELVWDSNEESVNIKLMKWIQFFKNLNVLALGSVQIKFSAYYLGQINKKIVFVDSLFEKRKLAADAVHEKQTKIVCK